MLAWVLTPWMAADNSYRDPTDLWCDACGCHQNNHLKLSSEHAALLGALTREGQVAERFFDETGVVHQDTIVLEQVPIAAATAASANADVEDGGEVPVTAAATKHGDATAAATNDGAATDASVAATGDREDGEDGATGTGNHVAC